MFTGKDTSKTLTPYVSRLFPVPDYHTKKDSMQLLTTCGSTISSREPSTALATMIDKTVLAILMLQERVCSG